MYVISRCRSHTHTHTYTYTNANCAYSGSQYHGKEPTSRRERAVTPPVLRSRVPAAGARYGYSRPSGYAQRFTSTQDTGVAVRDNLFFFFSLRHSSRRTFLPAVRLFRVATGRKPPRGSYSLPVLSLPCTIPALLILVHGLCLHRFPLLFLLFTISRIFSW